MLNVHYWDSLMRFLRMNAGLAYEDRHFAETVWSPIWISANACLNYDRTGYPSGSGGDSSMALRALASTVGYDPDLDKWTEKS